MIRLVQISLFQNCVCVCGILTLFIYYNKIYLNHNLILKILFILTVEKKLVYLHYVLEIVMNLKKKICLDSFLFSLEQAKTNKRKKKKLSQNFYLPSINSNSTFFFYNSEFVFSIISTNFKLIYLFPFFLFFILLKFIIEMLAVFFASFNNVLLSIEFVNKILKE